MWIPVFSGDVPVKNYTGLIAGGAAAVFVIAFVLGYNYIRRKKIK